MDINSLYYFSELAKDPHMTRTAERLFLSQQTLSNHIKRLEEECGVCLLHRKPKLALTYAGEQVLQFASLVTREHQNLKDILAEIREEESGVLRFGASAMRMNAWIPSILPEFSRQYPNVELRLTDITSKDLEKMVLDGELDLAVVLSDAVSPELTYHPLISDQVYLCVSDALLHEYYGEHASQMVKKYREKAFLKDFSRLPFCMLSNRMGQQIRQYFEEHQISPRIYSSGTSIQISTSISMKGLAASFASHTSLLAYGEEELRNIHVFPLCFDDKPFTQQLYMVHHKERYLSGYCRCFMELLEVYCRKHTVF